MPGTVKAQSAISFKPTVTTFDSDWIFNWVKPSSSKNCQLSGGEKTIMMICDDLQMVANHTYNVAPGDIKSKKMNNTGFSNVWDYEYRSDKRVFLQRNATGSVTGNLLLFDAEKLEWKYLFLFSTYYDIDWLAIN